ncbi:YihY/virulence factor BrkB family protein [Reinekea sp. G2M2-21]|uniref:YihY/virulence factor BrkB family protein n=1 Tax=Reinekea sp. G2M2-21 TaxID=2788942 RepID=UPI0018A90E40|nr:YhjD/YihY/BrkB family envelope integrity protein [Reinekea sp. G2M2-21]
MKALLYGIVQKVINFLRSEMATTASIGPQAAMLTLATLFAMVPMVSGILWLIGQLPTIQVQLLEQFEILLSYLVPEQAIAWRSRAGEWVQDVGSLQWFSVLMLFGSLLFLVNRVDHALHWVFQIDHRRGKRRWLHYLWVMPVLMAVLVVSMTLVVMLQILMGTGLSTLFPGINLTSIPALWLLLAAVYQLSSRGTVPWRQTLFVSFLVALSFLLLKSIFAWLYLTLPNWSVVFGVFSAIPLFLLWCQMAWSLFLYGALALSWLSRYASE